MIDTCRLKATKVAHLIFMLKNVFFIIDTVQVSSVCSVCLYLLFIKTYYLWIPLGYTYMHISN